MRIVEQKFYKKSVWVGFHCSPQDSKLKIWIVRALNRLQYRLRMCSDWEEINPHLR